MYILDFLIQKALQKRMLCECLKICTMAMMSILRALKLASGNKSVKGLGPEEVLSSEEDWSERRAVTMVVVTAVTIILDTPVIVFMLLYI